MRNLRYEIRACTNSEDHGVSVDGKIYTSQHDAQHAADAFERAFGVECYVWELPS